MICNICPRKCGAKRTKDEAEGFCGCGDKIRVSRSMLHFYEEPCISGKNGSGAIFFEGCNLKCVYCQNYEISTHIKKGKEVSVDELVSIMLSLKEQGAHNINLVTPSHFSDKINKALEKPIGLPVIYNCGGYEDIKQIKSLEGMVQIYLVDIKYLYNDLALKYSSAENYPEVCIKAVREMYRQVGDFEFDSSGMMQKGLIIRHLVLPGHIENSKKVIDFVSKEFENKKVLFSLMGQYFPCGIAKTDKRFEIINKKVSAPMYNKLCDYMDSCGIKYGYTQDLSSASSRFTPEF